MRVLWSASRLRSGVVIVFSGAGRILQGLGAATITPSSLSLIREAYPEVIARGRAIVRWALGGSLATAARPAVGGALTQVDWRLIFSMSIPVGVLALALLARVPVSVQRPGLFDWTGQVAAMIALSGLTFSIIEGADHGYGDVQVLASFALAAIGTWFSSLSRSAAGPP